ncbi:MAG: alginate lyase family protein [Rhodospirillales bacterium]|nr:alginate lyase family protein [Rhodospirillales bacterium]
MRHWSACLGLMGWAAIALPAAATSGDEIFAGTIACEASGGSPGFTQAVGFVVRDGRFFYEKGTAGKPGFERLAGTVTADGTLAIEGRYWADIEKPIRYEGRVEGGRMRAEGPHGPRRCALDAAAPPPSGATPPYLAVPDAAVRRNLVGKPGDAAFACPEPPAPVRDVRVEPFYQKGDPTHSIVDPEAYEARRKAAAPFDQLAAGIARLGDRYLKTSPRDPQLAACLFGWMETWAEAGAMLGEATRQGAYERKWTLTTLALNYGLLVDAPEIGPEPRRVVEAWLADVAWATVPDYAAKPFAEQNNHLNWAALAALATGVAVQDRGLVDWAVAALKGVVGSNIDADGSLPHELKRTSKAMHYHRFSLEPLMVAAEITAANGIDLYAVGDGSLHRLVAYTAAAMRDPDIVARRLGVAQSSVGADAVKPSMWAWAEPYVARFPEAEVAATLTQLRGKGLSSTWLGGDMTLRFGPAGGGL